MGENLNGMLVKQILWSLTKAAFQSQAKVPLVDFENSGMEKLSAIRKLVKKHKN